VTTSSPCFTPAASSDRCSAAVQELTATACAASAYSANACSKAATRGPVVSHPDSSVATTDAISASPTSGGANGTGGRGIGDGDVCGMGAANGCATPIPPPPACVLHAASPPCPDAAPAARLPRLP